MKFINRQRRQPPAVIIISLVDILVVLLIFLMVTTTFRRQPAVRLALPQSSQKKEGVSDATLIVTVAKEEPRFYLDTRPVTYLKLKQTLTERAAANPKIKVQIRADANVVFQEVLRVWDAAAAAHIKDVGVQIQTGP